MSDERKSAKPTLKPAKIRTDGQGRSVWADPVATAKFELVSTQELRVILESDDERSVRSIEDAAATTDDGVLARNAETGMFEIIDDTDLRALLDNDFGLPKHDRPADVTLEPIETGDDEENLSLVSPRPYARSSAPTRPRTILRKSWTPAADSILTTPAKP